MHKIIIDAGSTKSDIAIIDNGHTEIFNTPGINPSTQKNLALPEKLIDAIKECDWLVHYGAGIYGEPQKELLATRYKEHNVGMTVHVHSDMLGACRATAGNKPGIIGILGTGSNSCVYDGKEVVHNIPAMGYLLGDEGSGVHIGKELLKQYFNGKMPRKIADVFQESYTLNKNYVVQQAYQNDDVSRYLASHAAFLAGIKGKWKKQLLHKVFNEYIELKIRPYKNYADYNLYFNGSIAYHYRKQLAKALKEHKLTIRKVIKRPIEELIQFHSKNNFTA